MSGPIPEAVPDIRRRASWWVWLIPAAAALVALGLGLAALLGRGPAVTIELASAHGLVAGDVLRHRGMEAGRVVAVELDVERKLAVVVLRLRDDAADLAREGSRFWVERPLLGVDGVRGLDTLIGGPHLAVLPGDGPPQRHFVALERPPVRGPEFDGALELVLEAPRRGGLVPGAPVLYRQVPVGTVLNAGLAVDARTVEVRIAIAARYAELVRPGTRFWQVGGVRLKAGILDGLELRLDSLAALAQGGVAFATPPTDERTTGVVTGHRFALHDRPEDEWLRWAPSLRLRSASLGPGPAVPLLRRAALAWVEEGWWDSKRRRAGWVLPLGAMVLGPADLLEPPAEERVARVRFELDGTSHELTGEPQRHGLLALRPLAGVGGALPAALRVPQAPEDLVLVDGESAELVLPGARLTAADGGWRLAAGQVLDPGWHGAAALALGDGALIGIAVVDEDGATRVVSLDAALAAALSER